MANRIAVQDTEAEPPMVRRSLDPRCAAEPKERPGKIGGTRLSLATLARITEEEGRTACADQSNMYFISEMYVGYAQSTFFRSRAVKPFFIATAKILIVSAAL
jgi:hypothetical protein